MVDLSAEMAGLHARLAVAPGRPVCVVQFVAADPGEGVSTVAREFARYAAAGARRGIWLVELDLHKGEHHDAIAADPERYGPLGASTRASPDGSCFFTVDPKLRGADGRPWPDAGYLDAYRVGDRRWWITRFRREALKPGQSVRILHTPGYWTALRAHADYVVIDAPAASRSAVASALAARVDANVLVVSGERDEMAGVQRLRAALVEAGGRVAGVVFNRAPAAPPRLLSRLLP